MIAKMTPELYLEVKCFFTDLQYWRLLATSKRLVNELSFISRRIALDEKQSREFLTKEEFCSSIMGKVKDSKHQLKLTVRWGLMNFPLLENISCELVAEFVYSSKDPNWENLFRKKSSVSLNYNRTLSQFPGTFDVERLELILFHGLRDVSAISNLKELVLVDCAGIKDVSCLKDLSRLTLKQCSGISDVSDLGNIRYLTIIRCVGICDISGLTDNYGLSVLDCGGIAIVPSVCNAFKLDCDWPDLLLSQITFPFLKRIVLSESDIFMLDADGFLASLYYVELKSCNNLRKLSGFRHTSVVSLDSCESLEDISSLGNNHSVTIVNCERIANFSSLKNVSKLKIQDCMRFTNGCEVENVRFLTIHSCENFKDYIALHKVSDLNLTVFPVREASKGFGFSTVRARGFFDFLTNLTARNQKVVFNYDDFTTFRERVFSQLRKYYEISVEGPVVTLLLKKKEDNDLKESNIESAGSANSKEGSNRKSSEPLSYFARLFSR
jgi:hypothetical protein